MARTDKLLIYPLFIPQEACPGGCVYCDQHKITKAADFDLQKARREVDAFIRRNPHKAKEVAFYGGTFTALPPARQEELLGQIGALLDEDSSFRISTHPLYIDDEILERCRRFRVRTIELGIQDFADLPLRKSGRNYSGRQALAAAKKVKAGGFTLSVQLIPGLPGSDEESIGENRRILAELRPQFVRLYPLVVIKGTPLEKMYRDGLYRPLNIPEAVRICADYAEYCAPRGIRIIKYGLPSNIDPKEVAAGAFHPAFGELVKQELLVRKLQREPSLLEDLNAKDLHLLKAHGGDYLQQIGTKTHFCEAERAL